MPYPYLAITEVVNTNQGKAYRCILFEIDEDEGYAMVADIAEADDINRAILHIFHQHRDKLILPKVDHDTEGAVKFGAHYGLLMTSKTATQRWLAANSTTPCIRCC